MTTTHTSSEQQTTPDPAAAPASGLTADDIDALDDLVWRSLTTTHRRFAEGDGPARRFDPEVAGFVAIEHTGPEAWAALAQLVGPGQTVMLSRDGIEPPAGWSRLGGGSGYQMVLDRLVEPPSIGVAIEPLVARHVPQMLSLVELTQPGPFRPRTIELGTYLGVFDGDDLVAMAGERLQTPRFTEVSAVCTHPSARGRGLAAALSHRGAAGILARGQTPLLHVAKSNVGAQRVYRRLGFAVRRELEFVAVQTPEAP